MKRWLPLLIVLMLMSRGNGEEPALPRGLGFRTAGQPETAKQMRDDLWYVQQGIEDMDFDSGLKAKLIALIGTAERALDSAKDSQEAATIRDRIDRETLALLTVKQRQELLRRTTIAFVELAMLYNGFSARDINGDVVTAFALTAEQASKIRSLLDRTRSDGGANTVTPLAMAEARRAMRAVLSPKQRQMLDEKIEAGLNAARAEFPATQKNDAGR